MAVHVNGIYVVGEESNEKGNIIKIYKHEHGYYYYYTIKGNYGDDFFEEDSPFSKSLIFYGYDDSIKLKENKGENDMDEKIVVLRNGKAVTATKYADGKKVNSATAKCHPDDKFDFNVGAKIAVDRLIRENNNTDRKTIDKTLGEAKEELNQKLKKFREELCYTLDFISCSWDYFKKDKSQVKVTSENIESFLRVAEDKRIKWYNGENAMESVEVLKRRFSTTSEIYISYNNGMRFSISQSKNRVVVDWDKILPLFPKKIVYSNDFSWDGFLNGEVTVQMSKEDSVYFFWQFCFAKLTSYFSGIEKEFYDFKDYNPFMNFVFTLNKNDSIWCKMKDGKLVFCKAYGLSPIIPLYKYNGKKI